MARKKTNIKNSNVRNGRRRKRISLRLIMRKKLAVMMILILVAFLGLIARLMYITRENQTDYQRKILSQQRYDSKTLPFKRGTITDKNGTILAISEKVYNVVLDCKVMLSDEANKEPTLSALSECFGIDRTDLDKYVKDNPNSQYYVLKKRLTYDEIQPFLKKKEEYNSTKAATEEEQKTRGQVNGVWFEEEYIRRYPNNSLACDVIGFTGTDNNGTYGLEEYYNDELNGTNGREYGYLNDDATLERTTVAAVDGNSLVTTIDANIQAIAEKYVLKFNEEHKDEYREGLGSENTGCIVMNPNTGEILAMASYPTYDLNNPKDLSAYYTEEQIKQMEDDDTYYDTLNNLWRNYCISDTYEPGSTAKSLTLATGLETGKITGNETYECPGGYEVAGHYIHCNVRSGHGTLDVRGSLGQSCNVAFMKMGQTVGKEDILKFENIFNIGLKTNIDLAGESRTANLVFNSDSMGEAELATSSFGQGFNVTMIQMATAFSSIINGGYYYEPHVVNKITKSNGDVVKNIEPRVLKQTVSESTSAKMRDYLTSVVMEGTGKAARPAGYAIGGKTGTAERVPRDKINYVVSFIGFAPADDPQVVVYVVVDRPNVESQPHSTYASEIVKGILTEVLPYLHVDKTEEMTITEQVEVDQALTGQDTAQNGDDSQNAEGQENGDNAQNNEGQENSEGQPEGDDTQNNSLQEGDTNVQQLETPAGASYAIDPVTGELVDPTTGLPAEVDSSLGNQDAPDENNGEGEPAQEDNQNQDNNGGEDTPSQE